MGFGFATGCTSTGGDNCDRVDATVYIALGAAFVAGPGRCSALGRGAIVGSPMLPQWSR